MTHHYNLRNSAKNITTTMEQEQQIVNPPPASSVQPSSKNNAAPGPDSGPAMDMTDLQRQIAEMQQALNHVAARPHRLNSTWGVVCYNQDNSRGYQTKTP